jgi:ADP-ribose pyrophosphatase YjhB (NUDIX family)
MKSNLNNQIFTNADQEIVEYDGSPITWRISAYVFVIKDDSVLLIKNKIEKVYDIPGGGIEIGETIKEAVDREAMEEAGARVKMGDLVEVVQDWFQHANGNYYQTIQLYYTAQVVGELEEPTEETSEFVGFVKFDELKNYPLPKAVLTALEKIKIQKIYKRC